MELEIKENYLSDRMQHLSDSIDCYIAGRIEEERVICEVIEVIFQEGRDMWLEPCSVELKDETNYVLLLNGIVDLGTWKEEMRMFLIEGENDFVELSEIDKIYV